MILIWIGGSKVGKILKIVLKIVSITLLAVTSIYWFELDELALKKLEPTFRKFASKLE